MTRTQIINIIQSALTYLIVALPPLLVTLGCTQDAAGNLDCSTAYVSPKTMLLIVSGLGVVKGVILPWFTPGGWIRNLFGDKVSVAPDSAKNATPGTVAPADVR